MLNQDTARALFTIADEHGARVALVGDRHQLPAVGRGGVLDLAARWAHRDVCLTLDTVHRFTRTTTRTDGTTVTIADEQYAQLSLAMRTGVDPQEVFDALLARDQIRVHDTEAARTQALVAQAVHARAAGVPAAVVADTREQIAALNAAVRDHLVAAGRVDNRHATTTDAGQRIGVGDRVVTRRNDRDLRVANRDAWTVTHVATDGSVTLTGVHGARALPAGYVRAHVELAYASTVHGTQGDTTSAAHVAVGEHSSAASTYVGMTRGRELNVAHVVAADLYDAREQWCAVFARDRADLGPAHAAWLATREAERYARLRPLDQVLTELHRAWTTEEDSLEALAALERRRDLLADIVSLTRDRDATVPALNQAYVDALLTAERAATRAETLEATVAAHAAQLTDAIQGRWNEQRDAARNAAQIVHVGPGRLGQRQLAVRRATEDLARWSTAWQPYLPAMPTRTSDVAAFAAGWLADSPRIRDAFEQHARALAGHAHPEHHTARADAQTAVQRRDRAWRTWQDTRAHYDLHLSFYGQLGDHRDPDGYLAETEQSVTVTRGRLDTAQERVTALLAEPTLRTLPTERITAEREQWRAARDDHAAQEAEQAQRVPYRAAYVSYEHDFTPSPAPSRPAPAPSRGISR
jgi:exodeoxyribonuclease V alpha subunit